MRRAADWLTLVQGRRRQLCLALCVSYSAVWLGQFFALWAPFSTAAWASNCALALAVAATAMLCLPHSTPKQRHNGDLIPGAPVEHPAADVALAPKKLFKAISTAKAAPPAAVALAAPVAVAPAAAAAAKADDAAAARPVHVALGAVKSEPQPTRRVSVKDLAKAINDGTG